MLVLYTHRHVLAYVGFALNRNGCFSNAYVRTVHVILYMHGIYGHSTIVCIPGAPQATCMYIPCVHVHVYIIMYTYRSKSDSHHTITERKVSRNH